MKAAPECASCLVKVFTHEASLATEDPRKREKVIRYLYAYLARNFSLSRDPYSRMGPALEGIVKRVTGSKDPYRVLKEEANARARELLSGPEIRDLRLAIKYSLAGNALDFVHIAPEDAYRIVRETLEEGLEIDDTEEAVRLIEGSREITFVGDNAGELYFDLPLLRLLLGAGKDVVYVARKGPMINDATVEDVEALGLEGLKVVGHPTFGLTWERSPRWLRERLLRGLTISKGQAGYVTMTEFQPPQVIYILKVKCECISRDLGVRAGAGVVKVEVRRRE